MAARPAALHLSALSVARRLQPRLGPALSVECCLDPVQEIADLLDRGLVITDRHGASSTALVYVLVEIDH